MPRYKKLPRSFYNRPTLEVAPELLGKFLVYDSPRGRIAARIVEVEAYIGQDDPACHASRGMTSRTRVMFGPPGHTYIYLIYGMYHCLNFVTEPEGSPAAVLLRACEAAEGSDLFMANPGRKSPDRTPLGGPGKICRAFGLTVDQNSLDLTGPSIYLEDRAVKVDNIRQSQRIGIKVGTERPWRFFDGNSASVSGKT
ncbi:MAG: DNA-3-methyladenine glycosylase [bacterium]